MRRSVELGDVEALNSTPPEVQGLGFRDPKLLTLNLQFRFRVEG